MCADRLGIGVLTMDNTREKLIELIRKPIAILPDKKFSPYIKFTLTYAEELADHLIANGVTIQKEGKLYWKPVEKGVFNLTCSACDSHLGCRESAKHCPECGAKFKKPKALMPEPPKGE